MRPVRPRCGGRVVGMHLVRGDHRVDAGVTLADLPLGPWAGVSVQAWTTKTGQVWHADPECPRVKARGKEVVHRQPESGGLDQLALPDGLHCDPPGALATYRRAADKLLRYESETQAAEARLDDGDLEFSLLEDRPHYFWNASDDVLISGELAAYWEAARRRRERLVEKVRREAGPTTERAAMAVLAAWVREGRTPREHQDRFTRFHRSGIDGLDEADITYGIAERTVMSDRLSAWLDDVTDGAAPKNATRKLADGIVASSVHREDSDGFVAKRRDTWTGIGRRWEFLLQGMAVGYPDDIVAIFHEYGMPWEGWKAHPHARIAAGDLDWIVGRVPAALRPVLAERDRGLTGLVLADERIRNFDSERCALLLRNLLTSLGAPELAEHVMVQGVETATTDGPPRQRASKPALGLHWQQTGFASGVFGAGLTREQCLPALQAAMSGQSLPSPRGGTRARPSARRGKTSSE
jgi:hypothetical protein